MKFPGKVAVVTGASSGIGRAISIALAAEGCKLVLAARNAEKLQETARLCRERGIEAIVAETDVSVEDDCRRLISTAVQHFQKIDILVNNAGISMRALFEDTELSVIKRVMDINFWGAVYCTKYALPHLLQARGSLVGVSSIAGYVGLPARSGYSSSKFALNGFLECIRTENLHKGLHVLILAPGFTASGIREQALNASGKSQQESPRKEEKMMQPEEVARQMIISLVKREDTRLLTVQGKLTVLLKKFFPGFIKRKSYDVMAGEPDSPLRKA
ncbi:MAG: SDR family oxidoreductase [Bacteroidia bacterium]